MAPAHFAILRYGGKRPDTVNGIKRLYLLTISDQIWGSETKKKRSELNRSGWGNTQYIVACQPEIALYCYFGEYATASKRQGSSGRVVQGVTQI
jgi:hypothetical protein